MSDPIIDAIGTDRTKAMWYWESDGDPHAKTFYVVHTQKHERHDCGSKQEALNLERRLNGLIVWPDYPVGQFSKMEVTEDFTNSHGLIAKAGAVGYIRSNDRGYYGIDFAPEDTRVMISHVGRDRTHRFHSIPSTHLKNIYPPKPNDT